MHLFMQVILPYNIINYISKVHKIVSLIQIYFISSSVFILMADQLKVQNL